MMLGSVLMASTTFALELAAPRPHYSVVVQASSLYPPALHTMASAGSPSRVRTRSFAHGRAHSIVFHGIILSCLSCHSSCLSHRPMSWYLQLRVSVRCRGSLSLSSATFVAVIFFLSGLFVCRILFSSAGISIYPALFSVQRMRPRC